MKDNNEISIIKCTWACMPSTTVIIDDTRQLLEVRSKHWQLAGYRVLHVLYREACMITEQWTANVVVDGGMTHPHQQTRE